MALREFSCVDCEKQFKQGQYLGCMGDATLEHKVQRKVYYAKSLDARHPCNLQVKVRTGRVALDVNSQKIVVPDKFAIFQGGRFETQDPETQAFIEANCTADLCDREQWEEIGMTQQMKDQRLRGKLTEKDTLLAKQAAELDRLRALAKVPPQEEAVPASGKRK